MKEESIEDHGQATVEESERLVDNIDELFDPYLLGNIRKLVGVDLMRENEIYHLPRPGETVHHRKQPGRKPRQSKRASKKFADSARNSPISPQSSFRSSASVSSRPPVSSAESISTVSHNLARDRLLDDDVASENGHGAAEDHVDEQREAKRLKHSPTFEEPVAGPSSATHSRQTSKNGSRKTPKKLSSDVLAFQPDEESDVPSEHEEKSRGKKGRKTKQLRRSPTVEEPDPGPSSTTDSRQRRNSRKKLSTDALGYQPANESDSPSDLEDAKGSKGKTLKRKRSKRVQKQDGQEVAVEGRPAKKPRRRT